MRAAIAQGATTVKAVRDATNACTSCKTCAPDIKLLLQCVEEGRPFNPTELGLPGSTRHGASDVEGIELDGAWSEEPGEVRPT